MARFTIHAGLSQADREATRRIERIVAARSHAPVLLLCSGGSVLKMLDVFSSENARLGPHVTVSLVDDRYTHDSQGNNFACLLNSSFAQACKEAGCSFLSTEVQEQESFSEYGKHYERSLTHWIRYNPAGVVVALLGIGEDGHTAGIAPFPQEKHTFKTLFEQEGDVIVTYDAGERYSYPLRATVTNSFLRSHVDYAVVYAVGDKKKEALERVIAPKGELHQTPGRIIHEMDDVSLYTDLPLSY